MKQTIQSRQNPAVTTLYWCIAIMCLIWIGVSLMEIYNIHILPFLAATGISITSLQ